MLTLEQTLTKFRFNMIKYKPFYGNILFKLDYPVITDNVPTAATDGIRTYFNREFMDSFDEGERNFIILHELFHDILLHPSRAKNRNLQIWNMAADFIVNYYIYSSMSDFINSSIPISLPENILFSNAHSMSEYTVERLYDELYEQYESQGGGSENKEAISDYSFNVLGKEFNYSEVDFDLLKSANQDKISDTMKRYLNEALITSKIKNFSLGSVGMLREIEDLVGTKVNWYTYIRRYLSSILGDDTSFSSPDRNFLYMRKILPGVYEDETALRDILLVVDTSASISRSQLSDFIYQTKVLCNNFSLEGQIIFFDGEASKPQKINSDNLSKIKISGGGGTDVNVPLRYIKNNKLDYSCLIVLTDGYFSKTEVMLPNIIWCLTNDGTDSNISLTRGSKILYLK